MRHLCVVALTVVLVPVYAAKLRAQGQTSPTTAAPAGPPGQAATPAAPQPLPTPSMTAPLQTAVPHAFSAGPFGTIDITGIVSGIGLTQGNWVSGDQSTHWDLRAYP